MKRIVPPPGWLATGPEHIKDVCSVSDCVNDNIVDVQGAWQHNGFGLANSPDVLASLAADAGADVSDTALFYFTAYEREQETDGWTFDPAGWRDRSPARSAPIADNVRLPAPGTSTLLGYDVVVFGDFLEHSPLSCNSIAKGLPVNEHCLFAGLDEAIAAIDAGAFGNGCEEGVYTIFGVYRVR
ncbi:hypothetical protein [Sphingomonas sp. Leaf17]|uniref:hypothetical protein n=1 Tax=Sphingomonas sp. Leaf17 TaxID=1735683 RepID=UPI0012E2DAD8|nr:hypothetical protein [Sphingomonas sp. Leaf17]